MIAPNRILIPVIILGTIAGIGVAVLTQDFDPQPRWPSRDPILLLSPPPRPSHGLPRRPSIHGSEAAPIVIRSGPARATWPVPS